VVLDLGRTVRTATADQWRMLRLRDRGCTWPGCDRPPGWCQAHHITWWEHGGRTDIDGLTLLCNHHHHRIHDGGWKLERLDDGGLCFTGADGRVLNRPPPPPPWPMRPPPPTISPTDNAAIRKRARALASHRQTPPSVWLDGQHNPVKAVHPRDAAGVAGGAAPAGSRPQGRDVGGRASRGPSCIFSAWQHWPGLMAIARSAAARRGVRGWRVDQDRGPGRFRVLGRSGAVTSRRWAKR